MGAPFLPALKVIFFFTIGIGFLSKLPFFPTDLMSEDSVMALTASRTLLEEGTLKDWGLTLPFQAIRSESVNSPFWHKLIGPVLFYAPFLKVFGYTDRAYWIAQCLLLLVLIILIIRRVPWQLGLLFIGIWVMTGSLHDCLHVSRSRLMGLVIIFTLWERWQKPLINHWRWLLDGILIGIGCHFRDEVILLLPVFLFHCWWRRSEPRWHMSAISVLLGAVSGKLLGNGVRLICGAAHSGDMMNYLIGIDLFAPGFEVLGLSELPPLSSIVLDPAISHAFIIKVVSRLKSFLAFRTGPFDRADIWILFAVMAGTVLNVLDFRRYLVSLFLLVSQMGLATIGLTAPHYFDIPLFLMGWQCFNEIREKWQSTRFSFGLPAFLVGIWVSCVLARAGWRDYRLAGHERDFRIAQARQAEAVIPRQAAVITDSWILWNWYAGGRYGVLFPMTNGKTMEKLLEKLPEAYSVFFFSRHLHHSYREPLRLLPILLKSNDLTIYGARKKKRDWTDTGNPQ